MRYFANRNYVTTKAFDFDKVNDDLSKLSNKIEDDFLVTRYDGREICRVEVSKIYYNFDFGGFSKSLLSEILNYFQPEKYKLRIASGIQEIRLFGGELYIDNERYEKMISIVNSTDKSRALSMNIGLVKIEKNSSYAKSYTILTNFSNKHYKSSLPDKIKSFSDNLINFNINIDFHIKTIEDLKNKNFSIVDFAKTMIIDKNDKVIKSVELKLRAFGKKMVYDYNFYKKYNTLTNLTADKLDKVEDFEVNAKTVYNAYMELFKDSDTSIIARESRRVIEAIDSL